MVKSRTWRRAPGGASAVRPGMKALHLRNSPGQPDATTSALKVNESIRWRSARTMWDERRARSCPASSPRSARQTPPRRPPRSPSGLCAQVLVPGETPRGSSATRRENPRHPEGDSCPAPDISRLATSPPSIRGAFTTIYPYRRVLFVREVPETAARRRRLDDVPATDDRGVGRLQGAGSARTFGQVHEAVGHRWERAR